MDWDRVTEATDSLIVLQLKYFLRKHRWETLFEGQNTFCKTLLTTRLQIFGKIILIVQVIVKKINPEVIFLMNGNGLKQVILLYTLLCTVYPIRNLHYIAWWIYVLLWLHVVENITEYTYRYRNLFSYMY